MALCRRLWKIRLKFTVLNRKKAITYQPSSSAILIGIATPYNPNRPHPPYYGTYKDILKLKFHDIDREEPEVAGNFYNPVFFSKEDAQTILKFVDKWINQVEEIVVHCDAGRSRSAGVAAALSKIYTGNDMRFFREFTPNMHIYRTIFKEYHRGE